MERLLKQYANMERDTALSRGLSTPVLIVVSIICYYVSLWFYPWWIRRVRGISLPPGPKRNWFYGNLYHIPKERIWVQAAEWGKVYGPIVYIQVVNKRTIFLNSAKVALDLLESRSSIYSERPKEWMPTLANRGLSVFRTSFSSPRFKPLRRLLQDGLNPRAAKSYRPIQLKESRVLLKSLAESPKDFRTYIRRNAVAVIIKIAYGYQVGGNDDPMLRIMEDSLKVGSTLTTPGKYWVEFMPFLRFIPTWFPGAGFKRHAKSIIKYIERFDNVPFDWARNRISSGDYVESFASKHLVEDNGNPTTDPAKLDYIKWACSALYLAGGETIVSTMATFFLMMALHPDVQKRAQADIDQLVPNRLPTHDDFDSLPYIRAIIKEVLRWGPGIPLALPHCVREDDIYGNYFIPKGTTVFGNIWAIAHDDEMYPDPFQFDPRRHMGENPQLDPFKYIFGFGRRVCPGVHVGELSLFLNTARILAVFNVSKATDDEGKEVEPKIEWTTGSSSHLKPFECDIKPRSGEHLALLQRDDLWV